MTQTQPFTVGRRLPSPRWLKKPVSAPQDAWSNVDTRPAALTYADQVMNNLLGYRGSRSGQPIEFSTVTRARTILLGAVARESIYPTITPSGNGGLNLYWKAGPRSIEIELEPGHRHFFRVTDSLGNVT